ncbi:TPA: hypothetical protein ACKRYP_004903 [Pseudomonas aeruginosa]|uniref:hypothetical protein n=1 Tax=Pseudomonas aeruginosa TaxID=287 RepID=UPI0009AD048C|nr:hypothetical protein [Pseudomonas aeruginosa]OPD80633.1 hypothetical protein AO931_33375 [Pseudomonas aeruginosa]
MNDYKSAFNAAAADISAIIALLGFTKYPGVDPVLRAIADLILEKAESQVLREERDAANKRADTLEHRMMGMMTRHFAEAWHNRDTQKALDGYLSAGIAQLEQERDAALAKVERLRESKGDPSGSFDRCMKMMYERDENAKRLDAALARVAELEKGTVYVEARQCDECQHVGINDSADGLAACHDCDWTGPEPDEDKCPDCQRENCMAAACPQCGARYVLVASEEIAAPVAQAQHSVPEVSGIGRDFAYPRSVVLYLRTEPTDDDLRAIHDGLRSLAAAPGTEVPQAWLDVQAERRRQITAEGWTPDHDDAHSHGEMARAAACYALAGSSAPNDGTAALLVSLAWPWDEQWWKPTSARRDLVKACALALAEIERLDRAGISQNPQPGATTASS